MNRTTAAIVMLLACACSSNRAEPPPAPTRDLAEKGPVGTAVLAGGCFWCVEAVFEQLKGVTSVVSGYAGGEAADANYQTVGAGGSGHAEAVEIRYDPAQISYGTLLRVFLATHDPTQKDRQGPDWGRQYRSAIFFASAEQRDVAAAYLAQVAAAKTFAKPVATTLEPLVKFYPAEDYHQDYVRLHPNQPYVRAWVPAKLEKLRHSFPELLK